MGVVARLLPRIEGKAEHELPRFVAGNRRAFEWPQIGERKTRRTYDYFGIGELERVHIGTNFRGGGRRSRGRVALDPHRLHGLRLQHCGNA